MKKIILYIFSILSLCCCSIQRYSQAIILEASSIPVYANYKGERIVGSIDNSGNHELDDWCFQTTILNKRKNRFYVNILLFDESDNTKESLSGWIEKQHCEVFPRYNKEQNNECILYLFQDPRNLILKDSLVFKSTNDMKMFKIIDLSDKNSLSIKAIVDHYGDTYEGWVNSYCSNVYDSCN